MKKITYILILSFIISSCERFLDVKPVGSLIPTDVEQFDNLLYNSKTYDFLFSDNNRGSLLLPLSDEVVISDVVITSSYKGASNDRFNPYIFAKPYLNPYMTDDYFLEAAYKAALYFNTVIDGITDLGGEESTMGKQLIAQAKAGRAWTYLMAGITYGPMYKKGGDNSSKTISYRTSSGATQETPELSSVEELFNLVKEDLEYAVVNCPTEVIKNVRINKTSANAIMAQMYMFQADYDNMFTYAQAAWDLLVSARGEENTMYDFNDFSLSPGVKIPKAGEDHELYDALTDPSGDVLSNPDNKEILFYRFCPVDGLSCKASNEYIALFDSSTDIEGDRDSYADLRKKFFMLNVNTQAAEGACIRDVRFGSKMNDDTKMIATQGISTPELLLMLAEAAARTNKTTIALNALNLLRSKRYTPEAIAANSTRINSLTGDNLIQEILKERQKELPWKSAKRFWDLKRYNANDPGKPWTKTQITRTVFGTQYTGIIGSDDYQLEIVNKFVTFNPHWGLEVYSGAWPSIVL
jgi:hypothetical protein